MHLKEGPGRDLLRDEEESTHDTDTDTDDRDVACTYRGKDRRKKRKGRDEGLLIESM